MALPSKQIWKSALEAGRPVSRTERGNMPIAQTLRSLMAESADDQMATDFEGLLGRLDDAEQNSRKSRNH